MEKNTNKHPSTPKRKYTKPDMKRLTAKEIVEAMGPAQATGASGIEEDAGFARRRRRRRRH